MAKTESTTLWFTLEDEHTARWVEFGQPPRAGDLRALAEACAAAGPVVWLLDTRTVSCHDVVLPPASQRLQAQALPYALEDHVLGNLETLALASVALGDGRHGAAVTDREALAKAHAALATAGVTPTAIVPDALCLPWQEGKWSVLLNDRRGWLRCGQTLGFGFEVADCRAFLAQAGASLSPPARLRVFGPVLPDIAGFVFEVCREDGPADFLAGLGTGLPARPAKLPSRLSRAPGATDPAGRQIPDFAPLFARARTLAGDDSHSRQWRWAAGLALTGLACHAGFLGWHAAGLEREVRAVQSANEALLQERFPEITRVVDVRAQATQALAARTANTVGEDRFLSQLSAVGPILTETAGAASVAALDFERDTLELRVDLPDMAAVDRLQRALQAGAVSASTLSVDTAEQGVRLALRLGGAP